MRLSDKYCYYCNSFSLKKKKLDTALQMNPQKCKFCTLCLCRVKFIIKADYKHILSKELTLKEKKGEKPFNCHVYWQFSVRAKKRRLVKNFQTQKQKKEEHCNIYKKTNFSEKHIQWSKCKPGTYLPDQIGIKIKTRSFLQDKFASFRFHSGVFSSPGSTGWQ